MHSERVRLLTPAAEPADTLLVGAVMAIMIWAPLPLASNRTWAVGVLLLMVCVMWLTVVMTYRRYAGWLVERLRAYCVPLFLLFGIVCYTALQSIPFPLALIKMLSPEAAQLWQGVDPTATQGTVSLDPAQTQLMAALAFVYASMFTFVIIVLRTQQRLVWFVYALIASGVFQALLGGFLLSIHAQYEVATVALVHDITSGIVGTFVNRNHFAGYMEMCLALGIGMMVAQLHGVSSKGQHRFVVSVLEFILSPAMCLRLMLVVMVVALVLTRSRMGNAGFFAAMLLAGVVYIVLARRATRMMMLLLISLIIIDVWVIGKWVGLDKVAQRLEATPLTIMAAAQPDRQHKGLGREQSLEERTLPAEFALGILRDFPLTGTGAGTFYTTFPRYRLMGIPYYYDHAHNDYLELLTEYGLPASTLFALFLALTLVQIARTLRHHRLPLARGIGFGVLMAMLALLIHSTVDFNLQIPANALTFTVIMALVWVAARIDKKTEY